MVDGPRHRAVKHRTVQDRDVEPRGARNRAALGRRRLAGILMIGSGLLLLAGFSWLAVTGLLARSELQETRRDIATVRQQLAAGEVTAATRTVHRLAGHAGRAHALTTGPAWALAARLPAGGAALRDVRTLARVTDDLAHDALPDLVETRRLLDPAVLRHPDGTIDVARLTDAAPHVHRAAARISAALATVGRLPADTWLSAVDTARADVLRDLREVGGSVQTADTATRVLPTMLGADGVQRYFVAFQNGAEARGTGGLPGSFAILTADHGRLRFERFESDNALDGVRSGVQLGADFDALYGPARSTDLYVNSNISPSFDDAARIWIGMWQRKTGQRLDGALALDPAALSYLLDATGRTTLSDGTSLDGGNVAALTQSIVYRRFDGQTAQRRAYLVEIARKASSVILDSRGSIRTLLDGARRAVGERRLLVWSADPSDERVLAGTAVGGVLPDDDRPYAGLSVVNDGGDKLDYYLDRSVSYRRTGCGATRAVQVTITLTNGAPGGLPRSVTDRSDDHRYPIKPGDNRLLVSWFATKGAQLDRVTSGGTRVGATVGVQRGHPVYTMDLELPRGATRTVVLILREPGSGDPVVLRQPLVRPLVVRVSDDSCG